MPSSGSIQSMTSMNCLPIKVRRLIWCAPLNYTRCWVVLFKKYVSCQCFMLTRITCYTDYVANLTLAIEDHVLKAARKIAAEQDTTVNQLVRQYLEQLVSDRRRIAREKLLELMSSDGIEVGP